MYQTNIRDTENKETIEEIVEEVKIGIVTNCNKLNVREEPSLDADIVCEITSTTELIIDEHESTDEFYKVFTASGLDGFCMKKFISIQP